MKSLLVIMKNYIQRLKIKFKLFILSWLKNLDNKRIMDNIPILRTIVWKFKEILKNLSVNTFQYLYHHAFNVY